MKELKKTSAGKSNGNKSFHSEKIYEDWFGIKSGK